MRIVSVLLGAAIVVLTVVLISVGLRLTTCYEAAYAGTVLVRTEDAAFVCAEAQCTELDEITNYALKLRLIFTQAADECLS